MVHGYTPRVAAHASAYRTKKRIERIERVEYDECRSGIRATMQ
jgi:hypothetical protein